MVQFPLHRDSSAELVQDDPNSTQFLQSVVPSILYTQRQLRSEAEDIKLKFRAKKSYATEGTTMAVLLDSHFLPHSNEKGVGGGGKAVLLGLVSGQLLLSLFFSAEGGKNYVRKKKCFDK